MRWLWNSLIALDQLAGVLFAPLLDLVFGVSGYFGNPDETISGVVGKIRRDGKGNKFCRLVHSLLNKAEANHCELSIEDDEDKPMLGIQQDKVGHFVLGAIVAGCLLVVTTPLLAVIGAGVVGAGKEIWDKFHPPHCVEFMDFLATLLGGVFVVVFYYALV